MSEIWFRVRNWTEPVEEVEVLKHTDKTITYMPPFWKTPHRTFNRHEFFQSADEAYQYLLKQARESEASHKAHWERANARLKLLIENGIVIERLKKEGAA